MPRTARIVIDGYPHHIVQRGNNKQMIFFDEEDRELYLRLLKKYTKECLCHVHSYCLMDNHAHLLLTPQNKTSLHKSMQKLSLVFTQYVNKKYKRTGRLWECRFHSSLVNKDKYLWTVCRYIERNPVRAKIAIDPTKYKWSSAKFHILTVRKDNFVEPIWHYSFEREEYLKFLLQPDNEVEIEKIRKSTFKGLPFGGDEFLKYLTQTFGVIIKSNPRGRPSKDRK